MRCALLSLCNQYQNTMQKESFPSVANMRGHNVLTGGSLLDFIQPFVTTPLCKDGVLLVECLTLAFPSGWPAVQKLIPEGCPLLTPVTVYQVLNERLKFAIDQYIPERRHYTGEKYWTITDLAPWEAGYLGLTRHKVMTTDELLWVCLEVVERRQLSLITIQNEHQADSVAN